MDDRYFRIALDIAQLVGKAHKEHYQLPVTVSQRTDDLGIGLQVHVQAALPPNTVILGWIKGFWLGRLSAVDEALFRDEAGDFLTCGRFRDQTAFIYIPYGAAHHRGPGLYTLEMRAYVADVRTDNATEIGQADYKLALSTQPPWRRVEFFWPLIKLCMAIIRVDAEVLPVEIRGLREYLTTHLALRPEDMADLRTVLKDPFHGDLGFLLDSLALRLPVLAPEMLVQLLCEVARLDGPVNVHEFGLIRQVAHRLSVAPERCAELAATPPSGMTRADGRSPNTVPH